MPTPILQQMLGQGGSMEFVDAAVSGKNYDFLVVNTAATFTTLTGTGGENLLTAYNLSGKSVSILYRDWETDRKSTRLNSSHSAKSRMPSSA